MSSTSIPFVKQSAKTEHIFSRLSFPNKFLFLTAFTTLFKFLSLTPKALGMLEITHIDRDRLCPAETEQRHHKQTADIDMPQWIECQPPCTLCRRVAEPVGHKPVARLMKCNAEQRRGDEHCRLPHAVKLKLLQPCYKSVQIKTPVCRS